jgi:RibD C-terminal domain
VFSGRLGRPQQRRTDKGGNPDVGKIVGCTILSVDGYTQGPAARSWRCPWTRRSLSTTPTGLGRRARSCSGDHLSRGPDVLAPAARQPDASPLDHDIAKRYAEGILITVVSDTLTADDTGPWRDQTTIVRRADSYEAVARLREQEGDALIFGSQTRWADLLTRGLIDELHLMIGPKIVAGDHRAFEGVAETDLRLIGVRTWGGSDNVVLSYGLGGSPT